MPEEIVNKAILDKYEDEAAKIMGDLRAFAAANYGNRCETFDRDCPTCRVWKHIDGLEKLIT